MKKRLNYLKVNTAAFLLFEMVFRSIFLFFIMNGIGSLLNALVRFQGYSYVTQGNYKKFLCHPLTIASMFLLGVILLFFLLYEFVGLFILLDAGRNSRKLHFSVLLIQTWRKCLTFIRRHPLGWIPFLAVCLPNLCLHMLLWEVDRAQFIGIVAQDLTSVIGVHGLVILLASYLLLAVVFSQMLPYSIFQEETLPEYLPEIWAALKANRLKNILSSFWLHIRVFVISGIIFLFSVCTMVLSVRMFRPVNRYVSDVLFYGSILKLLIGILMGFLGTVTIVGSIYCFFQEAGGNCIHWHLVTPVKRKKIPLALGLVLASILIPGEVRQYIPKTSAAQDYMEITAHRGGAKFAPENTLAAIQFAIDTKSDYAEIDVQETKDGEIVLLHDTWLERTTGVKKYIWDVDLEEIRKMDAGSYFSNAFKGEKIPTLGEVLDACKGKIRLNIEIKANKYNSDIVEKVVEEIRSMDFTANCVVTSMDYKFLKEIKELAPEIVTGYTLSMVYGNLETLEAADFYSVKHTYINKRFVERVHKSGKQVCAWTLNNRANVRRVVNSGVDNVITDNPEMVRKEILQEYDKEPGFLALVKYAIQ